VLGFDTESKPTFARNEVSGGPHVVQLATVRRAFIFQLHDARCSALVGELLAAESVVKVGFGLGDDRKRIIQQAGRAAARHAGSEQPVLAAGATARTWASKALWRCCSTGGS
jgi:hypothetical protein